MSRYKAIMLDRGIMQKDVLDNVRRVDPRVDKPLMSKIVNDICLPTRTVLESVCKTLGCEVLDLYDTNEITLAPATLPASRGGNASASASTADAERKRQHRREACIYNLTVEVSRSIAERVFAPEALHKLGYLNKTDFVRQKLAEAARKLDTIEKKEKAAATTHDDK